MQLSNEQVDVIQDYINQSSIEIQSLKDDLLDHFCCATEMYMADDLSFEDAYEKAKKLTAPGGLNQIQHETIFLLNYNKIIFMKRLAYLSGFVFSLAWLMGIYFKLMHLPGANVMVFGGMSGVSFIFIPLLLINRFKGDLHPVLSEKLKWVFGVLGLISFAVASWMKVAHLAGATIALGFSFIVLGFGFLPFLFFRMYKRSLEKI